ncbi:MAG: DUF2892 domain-containing protein [Cyclobacteriaceae bacterium]|nr:DUF2892 domain-containing protein [Cyclobacteriaceae bacterium]MCK5368399.1 DUF2892 domain-containing protein [Cyclobacteriaceae bacterium]
MKNMGSIDRIIRVVVALIIGILFLTEIITGTLGIVLLIFAGIFLLTSLVSTCPLYLPFGIKTFKTKSTE